MTVILPEVNFLNTDPDALSRELITLYEGYEGRALSRSDPLHIIFLSIASFITKQNVLINDAAKQNLLYYARDKMLDHKGAAWDTPRIGATAAESVLRMYLSTPLTSSQIIKNGDLIATDVNGVFFEFVDETVIPVGVTQLDARIRCTVAGEIGNDFAIGQINTLVVPLPYISHVENITVSGGGTNVEDDESYRERIFLAPEKLSTAGSEEGYRYHTKKALETIGDVYVDSPEEGHVVLYVLMKNGELPNEQELKIIESKVSADKVRPLTDYVQVKTPIIEYYNLNLKYFVERSAVDINLIKTNVENAVNNFIVWQSSKIGRDINPSKLISDCIRAGAKRVDVESPSFAKIELNQVAILKEVSITFGGVEDD